MKSPRRLDNMTMNKKGQPMTKHVSMYRGGGIVMNNRGMGAALKKGGKVKKNTRRMNRLEELGRVDAERGRTRKGKRNLKAEKRRIVRELKK
jgi:hypothetical protein|tara:strand:+ start:289 stop:564 length:276 start_codon:yes stop_codon:yes gene_type:complete